VPDDAAPRCRVAGARAGFRHSGTAGTRSDYLDAALMQLERRAV
jgi:hypothetical protein